MGRGLFFGSYEFSATWNVGVVLYVLVIGTGFLGYVLVWGQISFWAATVITNFASAIPVIGGDIVRWLWGGFSVDAATLTRFYSFHFLLPFIILGLVGIHFLFLHQHGSSSPLGINSTIDKLPFGPYFIIKDLVGVIFSMFFLFLICRINPWALGDPENFIPANPSVTPVHIMPEWYFLYAYAILRAIPNKLGGVIALAASFSVMFLLPFFKKPKFKGLSYYPLNKLLFGGFIWVFLILTWIGAKPVEQPFIAVGQMAGALYFAYFLSFCKVQEGWDKLTR